MNTQQSISDVPQYLVIRNYLLECMAKGELEPGKQLPSERTLSQSFKTTRVTAREALLALETEGRIFRVNRQGWFVSPKRIEYNLCLSSSVKVQAQQQGVLVEEAPLQNSSLSKNFMNSEATHNANQFNSFLASASTQLKVAFYFDGRLAMVEHRTISEKMAALLGPIHQGVGGFEQQWQECLQQADIVESFVQPIALADELCSVFKVSAGAPGMEVKKYFQDKDGALIAETTETWRHDAVRFVYLNQMTSNKARGKKDNQSHKRERYHDLADETIN